MRKFISSFPFLFISVLLLVTSCKKEDEKWNKTQLKFISEEYKPFNFSDNSNASGLAPDLLKYVCSQLNMGCKIEFMPWTDGCNEVLNTDNTVLFTTVLNSVRKDKFKWAGPFASLDWNFYAAKRNSNSLSSLDDAKTVGKIGVIAKYATEEFLVQEGFTNLVYCNDVPDAFTKLLNGEIDLFLRISILLNRHWNRWGNHTMR
jgi:ABC-type amino acid transport substrate-binding protein